MPIHWPVWVGILFVTAILVEMVRLNMMFLEALEKELHMTDGLNLARSRSLPVVSVIVPAKDEEEHVEQTVRSLLASDYPNRELVLVDDRSRDGTRRIMERLAEEDSRIKVVIIEELPPGWTGKTNAMVQGVRQATGDILLFTDADAVFKTDTLSRSMNFFLSENLDMLSLIPGFTHRGFIEDAVHTHLALGISYFYPLTDVNDDTKPAGLASGCFIMMKRQAYEDVGTWERFRDQLTEDVAISRVIKAQQKRLRVLRAGDAVRTRPFDTLSDVALFWRRTFYGALEKSIPKMLRLMMNYVALAALSVLFLLSGTLCLTGQATWPVVALFVVAALDMAAMIVPMAVYIQKEKGRWAYALAAPIGLLISTWVCVYTLATVIGHTGIPWRGTVYR